MPGSRPSFEFGPFRLDCAEHALSRAGRRLPLTPKVYDVLQLLVENAGHLVEKERLLQEIWPNTFVEEGALNRAISVLRKTLGETAAERYIETVPKRGYRFVAAVRRGDSREASTIPDRAWRGVASLDCDRGARRLCCPRCSVAVLQRAAGTSGCSRSPASDKQRHRRRVDAFS